MMLYTKIATEIPSGTEITRKYIQEKYSTNYDQARIAINVLLKTGAVKVTRWDGKLPSVFELLPCARKAALKYEKKTSSWNNPAERKSDPFTPRSKDRTDITEHQFTEKQNRLISAFTAAQRELRKSYGGLL